MKQSIEPVSADRRDVYSANDADDDGNGAGSVSVGQSSLPTQLPPRPSPPEKCHRRHKAVVQNPNHRLTGPQQPHYADPCTSSVSFID